MFRYAKPKENVHKGLAVPYVSLLLRVLPPNASGVWLNRTRFELSADFAFAASKRTAKTEKLTHFESKDFLMQLAENLLRFKPRSARIANSASPPLR